VLPLLPAAVPPVKSPGLSVLVPPARVGTGTLRLALDRRGWALALAGIRIRTARALVAVVRVPLLSLSEINTVTFDFFRDRPYLLRSFIAISRNSSSLCCCSCFSRSVFNCSAILSALTANGQMRLTQNAKTIDSIVTLLIQQGLPLPLKALLNAQILTGFLETSQHD
jgi:hypothetical protein